MPCPIFTACIIAKQYVGVNYGYMYYIRIRPNAKTLFGTALLHFLFVFIMVDLCVTERPL